jgi:hypothetical protein
MTEFKAGEYPMRNGRIAVVIGEIPNPMRENDVLIGYTNPGGGIENRLMMWSKDGKYSTDRKFPDFDLMPRKKKIEQWIFSYYKETTTGLSVSNVGRGSSFSEANKHRIERMRDGWTCSEIVQAPVLEVDEE